MFQETMVQYNAKTHDTVPRNIVNNHKSQLPLVQHPNELTEGTNPLNINGERTITQSTT